MIVSTSYSNQNNHIDRYGGLQRLEIEVTLKCPLKCIHCSSRSGPRKLSKELSLNDIERIISEFSKLGGKIVTITGGEPLIKDTSFIVDILKIAKNCKLQSRIYTSGYLMNESIAQEIRDNGVSIVCVSVEGLEETHDKITRVKGSYKQAIETLRLLRKYGVPTRIHFTPMKINYKEFKHVANLEEELGIKGIRIFALTPQGRGRDNWDKLKLSPPEIKEFVTLAEEIRSRGKIEIEFRFGGANEELGFSCSVSKKIAVTCEGDALPCLGLREKSEKFRGTLGNITRVSLREIWGRIKVLNPHEICLMCTGNSKP